jgi:leader peptidase (prepilin peptidase)/N-methyltransferase
MSDLPREFVLFFLFVLGLCIGSFLNVCIHRFPAKRRLRDQLWALTSHSSGCPRCSSSIRWHDNVPLLGWLLLRGRCRSCRLSISVRYPLVELLTAVLFVVLYQCEMPLDFRGGVSTGGLQSSVGPQAAFPQSSVEVWLHVRYGLHVAMLCCLIVATFIDLELWIIPDGSTVPLMLFSVLVHTLSGQCWIVPLWFQDASVASTLRAVLPESVSWLMFSWDGLSFATAYPHVHGFLVSVAGFIAGGGIVWLVRVIGAFVLRREAMGFGDVVLMAMIGSVLGWQPVLVVFFAAPMLAIGVALLSLVLRRRDEIPYGPWLSLAALLLLVLWNSVWPMAERIFDMGPFLLLMGAAMTVMLYATLHLMQLVRRMLGVGIAAEVSVSEDDGIPMIYPGERSDPAAGLWDRSMWSGVRSGQGLSAVHRWRHGGRD